MAMCLSNWTNMEDDIINEIGNTILVRIEGHKLEDDSDIVDIAGHMAFLCILWDSCNRLSLMDVKVVLNSSLQAF